VPFNFAAGTSGDLIARYFAKKLSDKTGQAVMIENKPGAQGNISNAAVAHAKPDGYTIMITPGSSTLAASKYLFKSLTYDPVKDLVPVTTLAKSAFVMVVPNDSPVKTVAEMTARLKPGKGSFGVSTSTGQVDAALYLTRAGLTANQVNYKSGNDAVNDALGGSLDFLPMDLGTMMSHIKQGRLRPIAIFGDERAAVLPNVPTMGEAGVSGSFPNSWWGALVPAGTPEPIVKKLAGWFNEIVKDPETAKFLELYASEPLPGDAALLNKLFTQGMKDWAEWVRLAKIKPL